MEPPDRVGTQDQFFGLFFMKIIVLLLFSLVLLGAGCVDSITQLYVKNTTESYSWNAYDRVTATSTIVTFDHPSGYAIKVSGQSGSSERVIIGGLLGKIEIYNQDFYNTNNNDLDPVRPNETFKKGNFYVFIFHNKADPGTRDELLKIVNSIKIK